MSSRVSRTSMLLAGAAVATAAVVANHVAARLTEARHPPSGAFIEVNGVRLHYVERGSGEPIVLLHGNGATAEDFVASGILDRLASDHRVIAFDRPGFGYSERPRGKVWTASAQAELLHDALRRMGVHRPIVVGHSWGTLVALAMALNNRLDTAAIVLLSGFYVPRARMDVLLAAAAAVPVLGTALRYTVLPLLGWLMAPWMSRMLFAPAPVSTSFRERFPVGMALRPSQIRATAADSALMIPSAASLHPWHGEITMPVIIVAGEGDRVVIPARQSAKLHANLPHSQLRLVPGVGHMIHHSVPEQVVAAIRAVAPPAT